MSIDKKKIAQILYGGQEPATSFVPPHMMGYSDKIGLPFDPIKAKAELRASGLDPTHPITLELVTPNLDKQLTVGQFIQAEVKKHLGVNLLLQPFDNKTFRAQLDLHAYPLFEGSWSADYPDPDNFLSIFLSTSGNNRSTWKSESFDEKVLEARNLSDPKAREKIYHALQKILIEEEAILIPLYYEPNKALVKGRVKGLVLNPLNYLLLKKVNLGP